MVESIGADSVSEKTASNGRLDGNAGGKLERSPLGEPLGEYGSSEIGSFNGMSDRNGYGNIEVSTLVE